MKEASGKGLKAVTVVGAGEPLLHPDVVDILYGMKEMGLDIGIYTNGSMLKGKIAEAVINTCTFVRVSINAANSSDHEKVHRVKGQFETIVENVSNLVRMKQKKKQLFPTIGAQYVFFEDNYKSMHEAARLWGEIGIDYIALKPLIGGEESGEYDGRATPSKDVGEVRRYMDLAHDEETDAFKVFGKFDQYEHTRSIERGYGICYGHNIVANLLSDGNLTLCCNLFSEKWYLGNIYEDSFTNIWEGEKRKGIIKKIFTFLNIML